VPTPSPLELGGASPSVIAATIADSSALAQAQMSVVPLPQSEVTDVVHELLPIEESTKVEPLATAGSFRSSATFSIAGQMSKPGGPPRTSLIRVLGPDFNGRHQAAVASDGIVAATLTLPQIPPGRWAVAVEDLSQVHSDASRVESGFAVVALAIFDVD